MEIKERAQRRFSIGNQLMLAIFVLSLIFTIISSSISLYRDFNDDLARLDSELEQVKTSYLSSFSASLWVASCVVMTSPLRCPPSPLRAWRRGVGYPLG